MRRIIDIEESIYQGIINGKKADRSVEPREIVRSFQATIADAIAQSIPYNPTGDCISREALKDTAYINKGNFNTVEGIREWIDNAPPVPLLNEQIAWEQGYEAGLAQAVEITEEQAINKLHETGWLIGHDKEMTTRPQGEWIKEDNGKTTDLYRCSICGRSILLCKDADLSKYPFCHCGADMRKGGAE